jgi:hypothetical protein
VKSFVIAMAGMLAACGPRAFVEVTAESALAPPAETDNLDLTLFAVDGDAPLAAHSFPLTEGDVFPLVLVLEPDASAPHELRIHLVATLAGEPVAAAGIRHTWVESRINAVTIALEPLR